MITQLTGCCVVTSEHACKGGPYTCHRCSSVVRAHGAHGAMAHRIDTSWWAH